jgi:hypothetical protein
MKRAARSSAESPDADEIAAAVDDGVQGAPAGKKCVSTVASVVEANDVLFRVVVPARRLQTAL